MSPISLHEHERKLQLALASWRHWGAADLLAAPDILRPFAAGRSNHSWLVGRGDARFVVRLDGLDVQRLGLSRQAELRAQANAAERDLAPAPCWFNPEMGVTVSRYLPAEARAAGDAEELQAIAQLLRQIHQLPPIKFRLQPLDRARRYHRQLGPDVLQLSEEFMQACELLESSPTPVCLCHNDLLRANRIWHQGRLHALDWEYAAMGHPLFDLAVICEGDGLSELGAEDLLRAWNDDRHPWETLQAEYRAARLAYRELAALWEQLTARWRQR